MDSLTGQPASKVVVFAQNMKAGKHRYAETDAQGHYQVAVSPGNYNILAQAADRVCVAIADHECPAGETVELPPLRLIRGGVIAGRVMNTSTGKPESTTEKGQPIMAGLFGPSHPIPDVLFPAWLAEVDNQGRFLLRAAPGENYPYLINRRGSRMTWNTRKQAPIVVVEGETVETEIWCLLMRELVTIGSDAVPQLCAEFDTTTEQRMMRRLGVALRAIGDPRAVPGLIRAIPKTLLPSMSDFRLRVEDAELATFMQGIDLGNDRGKAFNLGRPVREIFGALHKISKQDFEDDSLFSVTLSDDPNRQVLQPNWPASIPQEEGAADTSELAQWAARTGVDLMCVIHRSNDGTATVALRAFEMRVHEISLWDAENIDKRLKSGKIPEGRPVGDLLLHYDAQAQKYVPDASGAFLYVTREGGMGMIHVTDRVTRQQDLTGSAVGEPIPGVGFQKGVRFAHRVIVR